ncbi:hypothetical protein AB162_246 [Candidatus Palibaumannia cicadellinicola]|uniref:Uncharacterized protein n=1 Tax=Candidatus Palibaumannia cicadellinicola TaxID=186490 RepID=A0A0K2BKX1_9GAMM|nr:hypothetical protein AB162_246 [Candidatus Baumannia cicadellinicola]
MIGGVIIGWVNYGLLWLRTCVKLIYAKIEIKTLKKTIFFTH